MTHPRLSVIIMAHPSRSTRAAALADELMGQWGRLPDAVASEVRLMATAFDAGGGCWQTARRAWQRWDGARYHLVLQDDVIPCLDFLHTAWMLTDLVREPITFYSGLKAQADALALGKRWISIRKWINAQALCLPGNMIEPMVQWIAEQESDPDIAKAWKTHDDTRIGTFLEVFGLRVLAPCPSLVEHGDCKSVQGHPSSVGGRPRKAKVFIGATSQAMAIDWKQGLDVPLKTNQNGIIWPITK
jgi:hypothetical protein